MLAEVSAPCRGGPCRVTKLASAGMAADTINGPRREGGRQTRRLIRAGAACVKVAETGREVIGRLAFGKPSANMARARNFRDSSSHFHANPWCGFEPPISLPCRREKLSFLGRIVIAGFGQARHVEFDWVAAFVASGGKEATNNAGQGQNETAHALLPVGFCLAREKLPRQSSKSRRRHRRSSAGASFKRRGSTSLFQARRPLFRLRAFRAARQRNNAGLGRNRDVN